jgi:Protein kinase domain
MVMEYAAGGSLHSILLSADSRSKLAPGSRLYVAEALIAALQYLHENKVFHRDVKPENMCFWDGWDTNPKMVLIDFGIASRVAERASGALLTSCPGTVPYMAEECLLQSCPFTDKSEVFAVGVVLANLITGDCSLTRFNHRNTTPDEILSFLDTTAGPWTAETGAALSSLACLCLKKNPDERPTVSEVLVDVKQIRSLLCSDDVLEPRVSARIRAHNTRSRPSRLPTEAGPSTCVCCNMHRAEGVTCGKGHFTCVSGTCLEETVRAQLGDKKFKCPGPDCIKFFQPIDFYGKLGADLYGDALLAADQVEDKSEAVTEMNGAILQAIGGLKETIENSEQSRKGDMHSSVGNIIGSSLATVRDGTVDLSVINTNINCILKSVDERSRKEERFEKDLRRLSEKQARGERDLEAQFERILQRIESLRLAHAEGVAQIASGRLQCPRLCILWPVRTHRGLRRRFSIASEYQLVFLCAHDRSPVRTSVTIKEPKKWLKKAAPLVKFALFSMRTLAIVCGGIPLPSLPDFVTGNSMLDRMDQVLQEMEILLEQDDIRSLEEWVESISDESSWIDEISSRERQITEEAYGALVEEAYKPKNRGWMNEMEIAQKDGAFAWVKKENVRAWKSSSG